ncbi:hypothetical protein [Bifidobacterium dentium]|uniref:hypothetical protein n=1 Tax=Bifidobacterium dentium TaxID=1689 RepID=UPI0001716613|nr:hypothetical protein [Bifidobacterium dentium]EDT45604.1 hypothetical protein BIFDEN_01438 [Bifidobacterium dentium ATCC 27678]BAQ27624.1 hypothetical protein BBDE_1630 [Bifidobacterium dentium JCM 1195 = DSM 20436]VEG24294.1 Uncharacterised protein [Bifidobacterium dentium]
MSYAIVNSRATDGIAPGTKISYRISPWKIWLYSADAAVAILAIGMTVVMIRRTKHAKATPDLYKPRKLRSKSATGRSLKPITETALERRERPYAVHAFPYRNH